MPLRLSVEERVEHAVSSAVRRALAEQRKTQEEELDSLSDVLQRCGAMQHSSHNGSSYRYSHHTAYVGEYEQHTIRCAAVNEGFDGVSRGP